MRRQYPGSAPSRRAFLAGAAALGATAALPEWPAAGSARARGDHQKFRVSLSVSPFTEAVLASLSLTDGWHTAGTVRDVQRLFRRQTPVWYDCTQPSAMPSTASRARSSGPGWLRT